MKPRLDWLLIFVPIAAWLHFATSEHTWVFITASLAIIPVAGWMGRATEHLAAHTGEGIGGLLNATFGNAAELIIALVALSLGNHDVVKASITGSIIGNILLVLGAAITAGGLRHSVQRFNGTGAHSHTSMLLLAAAALLVPAVFHMLGGAHAAERDLSLEISVVLLVTYAASLVFTLKTHRHLYSGGKGEGADPEHAAGWSIGRSVAVLTGATVLIAVLAEWLVGSVEHAAHAMGMSNVFVGVIIVAIVGNAAEHSTAIFVARKNRMDLAIGIALGSSIQIALFVAPVLVLASYWIGPGPMDLVFTPAEVFAMVMAVLIAGQILSDGESHWLEGVQLLSVYIILALLFYWLPSPSPHAAP
ncbi:MAG: calcium/proton exchanger [Planctomycetota bacterium]